MMHHKFLVHSPPGSSEGVLEALIAGFSLLSPISYFPSGGVAELNKSTCKGGNDNSGSENARNRLPSISWILGLSCAERTVEYMSVEYKFEIGAIVGLCLNNL